MAELDLTPVFGGIVALGGTVLTALIIPFMRSRITAARLEQIRVWARIAVTAAELIFPQGGRGREKKEYVLKFLCNQGIKLGAEPLNLLVECAVGEMNKKKEEG